MSDRAPGPSNREPGTALEPETEESKAEPSKDACYTDNARGPVMARSPDKLRGPRGGWSLPYGDHID